MNNQHKAARQFSDQMMCSHCGKAWDVNDPEPPECTAPPATTKQKRGTAFWVKELKGMIKNA